ncbi:restriction endonuclease subunit S [Bifidobacterium adolescentis]|uniref:restriction endonuclease subunit S n=1 Tax=Bifidobacterium adolescentis TaxID=1680 RepID=UPI00406442FD
MAEQHGKALVPQIRFAGFTDPWEQRKLGELFEEHSEKDRDDLPALTIIQGGGTVHRDESNRNLQFDRNSLSNYKVVDTGDFIVHLRSFEGGLEKATCCGLVSPAYHIFRGKNVDSDFYYLYFRSKRFIDADLKPHVYGIRDGRSIDIEGMKTIFIPWTNLAEQRRIGAFFDHLDSLITLHQRKYDKLCVLKKSMLDKMFPKGGSLYPEIRFAGFTDPWEQRKLGELTESYSGGTPAAGESEFYGGSIPFIRSAEIAAESTELFLTEKGYESSSARMVKPGDVLYALYGATSGEVAVSRQKGAINQAILAILPRDDCDARYITAWLRKQKGYIVTTYLQGGQGNLSGVIVKNLEVFIPSLPEQQKIGFMLSHLDSLITLHQRKLELLRNIKKSMLDKMFV